MRKKLILVAAPPACGKTYVSELISRSVGDIVYLDKDGLAPLLRTAFSLCGEQMNMDGDFYRENLRASEYETLTDIALSALRFSRLVLVNAPFGREVRDAGYMRELRRRAAELSAELILIWISVPLEVCYSRMKARNSERDVRKLENFEEYAKGINYAPPTELLTTEAVDSLLIFDGSCAETTEDSLSKAIKMIRE